MPRSTLFIALLCPSLAIGGSYRHRHLAPHIAEIQMNEAHPAGPAHYTLLLTCLTDHQGRFYLHPARRPHRPPRQRQNSGRWTPQP